MKIFAIKYKDTEKYHKKVWMNMGHLKLHLRTCKLDSYSKWYEDAKERKDANNKFLDNIEVHIFHLEEQKPEIINLILDENNEWNV